MELKAFYVLFLLMGTALFFISVFLRARSNGKYDIKSMDLALIFVPLLIGLIATGKIKKLTVGGVAIETAEAFVKASRQPIAEQIAYSVPVGIEGVVRTVETGPKGAVDRIPELIRTKTEALEFYLGSNRYWGPAIEKYLESLDAYNFLRYAIVYERDGTLFGIFRSRELLGYFRKEGRKAYAFFAEKLNSGDKDALKDLPGFIRAQEQINTGVHKKDILKKMEESNLDILPVTDKYGRFVGVVQRDRIVASLIIDIAAKLEKAKE